MVALPGSLQAPLKIHEFPQKETKLHSSTPPPPLAQSIAPAEPNPVKPNQTPRTYIPSKTIPPPPHTLTTVGPPPEGYRFYSFMTYRYLWISKRFVSDEPLFWLLSSLHSVVEFDRFCRVLPIIGTKAAGMSWVFEKHTDKVLFLWGGGGGGVWGGEVELL